MRMPHRTPFPVALTMLLAAVLHIPAAQAKWNTSHISFQGLLSTNGTPFTGTANFKFAIVAGSGPLTAEVEWSNDGTAYVDLGSVVPPSASVALPVSSGNFNVLLGAPPMTAVDPDLMLGGVPTTPGTPIQLLIWVDTGSGFVALPAQTLSNALHSLVADVATRSVDRFTSSGDLLRTSGSQAVGLRQDAGGSWLTNVPNIGGFGNTAGGLLTMAGSAGVVLAYGDGAARGLTLNPLGDVGIGTETPQARLDVDGVTRTTSLEITGGADLAERFEIMPDEAGSVRPGMVVCIDPANPGRLRPCRRRFDRQVVGVVSGAGDINSGMILGQAGSAADGVHPVALTGRVYCLAEAESGAIEPGDFLTTSSVPGHAMRVNKVSKAQGAIIGKALTGLTGGRGLVLVLVSLQ